MMRSQSMQTLANPAFQRKMPLFDGTTASNGLSKNLNMSSDFRGKQTLPYGGTYYAAYEPREKDPAEFTPWNNPHVSLSDGRGPVSHCAGMEGRSHMIYRQDSNSSEEGHSHSSFIRHPPVKQGFTLYNKRAGMSSPTAARSVDVRKQKAGAENLSPPSDKSVYVAIPRPVYGRNPCCNELGCVLGQRYGVEHGNLRIPNTVYEHEWMQTDAPYTERLLMQRKAQDALLQQRGLQFEPSAEHLKMANVQSYGSGRTKPAMMEPHYPSYPCALTHTLFGSLSEPGQRLQTPPRGYASLYPSHPTYEHMTSELYQEQSPMSKYGQLTQHPMFYYPQANVEVEKRTQCKDIGSKQREDDVVFLKHTIPKPREHYIEPDKHRGEIPLSSETLPNQSFMHDFDYTCYALPRFNINANQMRAPVIRQHASPIAHPNRVNVSVSGQYVASPTHPHEDKPNISLPVDLSQTKPPVLRMDKASPSRRMSHPGASPSNKLLDRLFPHLSGLHMDRPVPPPNVLNMERVLDYSSREAQALCPKWPQGAWVARSPHDSLGRTYAALPNGANVPKHLHSPTAAAGNEPSGRVSSSGSSVLKQCLKRSLSHSSSPINIKEDNIALLELELIKKRQKLEMLRRGTKMDSPPMPVIDNVFSLAPYQAYQQASGVLFARRVLQRATQSYEHAGVETRLDASKTKPGREEQKKAACLLSKATGTDAPAEKPAVKLIEPKDIKVEKVDPPDTNNCVETQRGDCSQMTIKKEPDETGAASNGLMLVIKKCEPDELESKHSAAEENEASDELKPSETMAQVNSSSSHGDAFKLPKQVITFQPKPIAPGETPEIKLKTFKNIPPHCLKLSTYKIVLPDTTQPGPAPPPEQKTESVPKITQTPVRQHFLELHQSLCKLLSKSVSASSEQDLRDWLSRLKLTEAVSGKVPRVSCLLGREAREEWLNEEMRTALLKLLQRLREYTAQERCPFPHVMRTRAVFLPMLVVKELLFPTVPGAFIDQVLQEHRVELRPTTLSEEKTLIQLHKRACSSKLRRLMCLKHLPDIYADVVNLLYYTCVCKHLGLEMDSPADGEEGCEGTAICRTSASPASPAESHPERLRKERRTKSRRDRTKSRVKSSSRRLFLNDGSSGEEEEDDADTPAPHEFSFENTSGHESDTTDNGRSDWVVAEQDSSRIPLSAARENSWTCPIALDELSQSPSDTETEASSSSLRPLGRSPEPDKANNNSGVILKLRRMFGEGLSMKKARYKANLVSGTFDDRALSQTDDGEGGEMATEIDYHRRTPKVTHRWQRTDGLSHALRPLPGSSSRRRKSLLKIKYCPFLSACHSAEHRRRWVLRSAVQRARRAMRVSYPDLVGKTIRHLYEEDDKSEVWYRGEVLRVTEANENPLKTVFEVRYDSEPEWKYYLELLIDYKKGWLKIED